MKYIVVIIIFFINVIQTKQGVIISSVLQIPFVSSIQAAGYLNKSFGGQNTGGVSGITLVPTLPDGTFENTSRSGVLTPDGKILQVGTVTTAGTINSYAALVQFTANGILDTTFGGHNGQPAGTVILTQNVIPGGRYDTGIGIALQSDGKIVIAMNSQNGAFKNFFSVARFLPNGLLDETFGGEGGARPGTNYLQNTISGGPEDSPACIGVSTDNKIYIGGITYHGVGGALASFALVCFLSNGLLDQNFGGFPAPAIKGTTYIPPIYPGHNAQDTQRCLLICNDNTILLGGGTQGGGSRHLALASFLSDGSLNENFGGQNGANPGTAYVVGNTIAGATEFINNMTFQENKIVTSNSIQKAGSYFGAARFLLDGKLDTTFGGYGNASAGTMYIPLSISGRLFINDSATTIIVQPDQKIVLGGLTNCPDNNLRLALARLEENGTLDPTFGGFPSPAPLGALYVNQLIGGGNNIGNTLFLRSNGLLTLLANLGGHFGICQFTNNYTLATYQKQYPNEGGFY